MYFFTVSCAGCETNLLTVLVGKMSPQNVWKIQSVVMEDKTAQTILMNYCALTQHLMDQTVCIIIIITKTVYLDDLY